MPDSTVDIHPALVPKFKFTGCVATVVYWQERWRKERRFTLPAVSVTRQNPSSNAVPHRQVDRVGIVAEHQARSVAIDFRQNLPRTSETASP